MTALAELTTAPADARRARAIVLAALLVGLGARAWLVSRSPPPAMLWDHHEYVCWGAQMLESGVRSIYSGLPPACLMWDSRAMRAAPPSGEEQRICNYPPLAPPLLAAAARALRAVEGELVSNTRAARAIFAAPSFACDLLLAWGVWAIARRGARPVAAAVAFGTAVCAPPLILDSARWGQTDAWVLAPGVWMLWCMLERRWLVAGVLWGVALGLKTQGVLLAPIWMFAWLLGPQRGRIAAGAALAGAVLLLAGAPYLPVSGWAWLERGFADNLLHAYPQTTLKAFNIWYVDLLLTENDDATRTLLGVSKDAWGRVLLLGALLAAGWRMWRFAGQRNMPAPVSLDAKRDLGTPPDAKRDSGRPPTQGYEHRECVLSAFAAAVLLLLVILPTRVHERYLVLCIPFLIVAAALRPQRWWGVVPLIVAATFQIAALEWVNMGAETWGYIVQRAERDYERLREVLPPEQFAEVPPPHEHLAAQRERFERERRESGTRGREWALTVLELCAAALCLWLLCAKPPPAATPDTRPSRPPAPPAAPLR